MYNSQPVDTNHSCLRVNNSHCIVDLSHFASVTNMVNSHRRCGNELLDVFICGDIQSRQDFLPDFNPLNRRRSPEIASLLDSLDTHLDIRVVTEPSDVDKWWV